MASNSSSGQRAPTSAQMSDASPKLGAAARAAAALAGGPVALGRTKSPAAREGAHPYVKKEQPEKKSEN